MLCSIVPDPNWNKHVALSLSLSLLLHSVMENGTCLIAQFLGGIGICMGVKFGLSL
jgi:hypothetical protein